MRALAGSAGVYDGTGNGHSGSRMDSSRPLGDAPDRSYVRKLEQFARFAEPELERIFADLALPPGAVALDLGCGAGLATRWLRELLGDGYVVGVDLSLPHLKAARRASRAARPSRRRPAVLSRRRVRLHLGLQHYQPLGRSRRSAARASAACCARGGRLALAQSGFLPDMFFAWDAPLEDAVRAACHRAYRERYGLGSAIRQACAGSCASCAPAGFASVATRTYVVERVQPLRDADRDYLRHAIFEGAWGEKSSPIYRPTSALGCAVNCDPASPEYCLDREDFHHVQTLTVCEGRIGAADEHKPPADAQALP